MDLNIRRRFDYDRARLPNPILAEAETGVDNLEQARARSYFTIGYPGWNLLYYACFCSLRPGEFNLIVETGTNWGFSSIVLGQALKDSGFDGKVYSVDVSPENLRVGCRNIAAAGLSSFVDAVESDSVPFLTKLPDSAPVAFAFLDSNHLCEHVKAEFSAIYPRLDNRSVVFFDNTAPHSNGTRRVHEALQEIQGQYGGNLINFPNTSWDPPGQAIWQRNGLPA